MAQTWRTIRVFISSTFRDMHAEKEELVKRTRFLCYDPPRYISPESGSE
jgi:hypothetical protein